MSLFPKSKYLLIIAAILGGAGCQIAKAPSLRQVAPAPAPAPAPAAVISDTVKTHALAFGAILDTQNGDPHSRLVPLWAPAELEEKEKNLKGLLPSWWGIQDREGLLDTLDKLQSGEDGQRQGYWDIRQRLLLGKMENYLGIIKEEASETNSGERAFIVATHLGPLHGGTLPITAWDIGRYINLCRWGVQAGWISEQEAWDRIIPAARLLQASYTSWADFASDYLRGRNFWNPQTATDNETIRYSVSLLMAPPKGLWSTIDWSEPLGTGPVLRDSLAAKLLDHYEDPDPNAVSLDHVPHENPLLMALRASVDSK